MYIVPAQDWLRLHLNQDKMVTEDEITEEPEDEVMNYFIFAPF